MGARESDGEGVQGGRAQVTASQLLLLRLPPDRCALRGLEVKLRKPLWSLPCDLKEAVIITWQSRR